MKKIIFVFVIMFIVSCGFSYADNYGVNSAENDLESSELQGHSYRVIIRLDGLPIPIRADFCFDGASNFILKSIFGMPVGENSSGSYILSESKFALHSKSSGPLENSFYEFDCEGTSVPGSPKFIYGWLLMHAEIDGEIIYSNYGVFFGISRSIE
jgi:hypothetical protein